MCSPIQKRRPARYDDGELEEFLSFYKQCVILVNLSHHQTEDIQSLNSAVKLLLHHHHGSRFVSFIILYSIGMFVSILSLYAYCRILFQKVATSTSNAAPEVLGTEYGPDLFKRFRKVVRNRIHNLRARLTSPRAIEVNAIANVIHLNVLTFPLKCRPPRNSIVPEVVYPGLLTVF